ncbi:unnamed protein product [Miscanthus lutarioriparius]|uniref:DUF4220 domain-containing protein n=1 Tax=Miscanthus lutarioriparius TaxID=422564 RepID=A0A811PKP3_9POAL|nr:unnamed protein product [Miscanthus lutarioriparius]
MYPIWAVSLLALLCCVDSAAASGSGLDNRSQLWKMLYQLCLYFGYVLLMRISTISSDIGNIAICVLSAVTFIKGFHRSMALVVPSSMRNMVRDIPDFNREFSFRDPDEEISLFVDMPIDEVMTMFKPRFRTFEMREIAIACRSIEPAAKASAQPLIPNYERAFKVVEIELAFLYDILYTSNAFLDYYEASSASVWAFASLTGVLQLLRCWTSNWARVAFACDCARKIRDVELEDDKPWTAKDVVGTMSWGIRLRASLIRINWSDKHQYLWQNKLGQHSLLESISLPGPGHCRRWLFCGYMERGQTLLRCIGSRSKCGLHLEAIGEFVSKKIESNGVSSWASSKDGNNGQSSLPQDNLWGYGYNDRWFRSAAKELSNEFYVCVLMWHIATCYCELAQQRDDQAPGLLPGGSDTTKRAMYAGVREVAIWSVHKFADRLRAMREFGQDEFRDHFVFRNIWLRQDFAQPGITNLDAYYAGCFIYAAGVKLGEGLHTSMPAAADRWKLLAEFWVKASVYAAPSDKVDEHLQHLSQGGELITHLWALLYHAGIHKWRLDPRASRWGGITSFGFALGRTSTRIIIIIR